MSFKHADESVNLNLIGELIYNNQKRDDYNHVLADDREMKEKIPNIDEINKHLMEASSSRVVFIKEYLAQLEIQDTKLKLIKRELKDRKEIIKTRKQELKDIMRELKQ